MKRYIVSRSTQVEAATPELAALAGYLAMQDGERDPLPTMQVTDFGDRETFQVNLQELP